jgi:hypothetical protein
VLADVGGDPSKLPRAVTHASVLDDFGALRSDEQESVLGSLLGTIIPSHRHSEAILALLEGSGNEDVVGVALAAALHRAGPHARRRCFTSLVHYADVSPAEREQIASVLTQVAPWRAESATQTEMSLAEVDEQYEALTLALTEAKMAPVGQWEARAVDRMADRRGALARMAALTANEEGGPEINPEIALEFRAVLSWHWRPGAADLLSLPELLRRLAALFADKAEEDARLRARGIGEPVSLIRYLCEKAAPPPRPGAGGRAARAGSC